ncbi:MAG: RNA 3'-terminal phosphate cyclase [Proteobacteria bacterium]|nr:RNA 3'-terminal phosphate cyclase [Pseudomonadota bacterium]
MLTLDGCMGEGGGQVLRSSLSLSARTGQAFRIDNIRAGRRKPGLLRQHLTCVRAVAEVCGAEVEGASLGSTRLVFRPGPIRAGTYHFAIGSAGSAHLVLQTLLPVLWAADGESEVVVEGGTHNDWAPPFPFLDRAFAPAVSSMGAVLDLALEAHGFYPAGGGRVRALVAPSRFQPLEWVERGAIAQVRPEAVVSGIPTRIAVDEIRVMASALNVPVSRPRTVEDPMGPGNLCWLDVEFETGSAVFCGFGKKGVSSHRVAKQAVKAFKQWRAVDVPVDEFLADQLLLPLSFAGSGTFRTTEPSLHTRTNAEVIQAFTGQQFRFEDEGTGAFRVTLG